MKCLCEERKCCPIDKTEEVIELLENVSLKGVERFNAYAIRPRFGFHQARACRTNFSMYVQHSNMCGYRTRIVDHRFTREKPV
jgi:hypothetical protein